jgi:hypothetical protein
MVTSVEMADGSLSDLNYCRLRVSFPSGACRADQRAPPRTGALTERSPCRWTVRLRGLQRVSSQRRKNEAESENDGEPDQSRGLIREGYPAEISSRVSIQVFAI